jgi:hypothetical protein
MEFGVLRTNVQKFAEFVRDGLENSFPVDFRVEAHHGDWFVICARVPPAGALSYASGYHDALKAHCV